MFCIKESKSGRYYSHNIYGDSCNEVCPVTVSGTLLAAKFKDQLRAYELAEFLTVIDGTQYCVEDIKDGE